MVLSLKLFLSACFLSILVSCNSVDATTTIKQQKNQLIIVVDKSSSVSYGERIENIRSELKRKFEATYENSYENIQLAKLEINGDTRVVPQYIRYAKKCPTMHPESRSEEQDLEDWQDNKKKWLNENTKMVLSLIEQPPYSQRTDVLGIFDGIQQVQKSNGPWEKIGVIIFSDMIHTINNHNMRQDLTASNAYQKGESECQSLLSRGGITKADMQNLHFTIYTPDKMENSQAVLLFWKGFFAKWGLQENQWQFE